MFSNKSNVDVFSNEVKMYAKDVSCLKFQKERFPWHFFVSDLSIMSSLFQVDSSMSKTELQVDLSILVEYPKYDAMIISKASYYTHKILLVAIISYFGVYNFKSHRGLLLLY